MAADTPTPLATVGQLTDGPLADLVTGYDTNGLTQLVLRATRECEGVVNRRLAPFTGHVEAVRASGVDPDEYGGQGSMPLDLPGTLGRSFAGAMGAGDLVRHVWLSEFAPRYPEMWAYNNVTITIVRSYGGNAVVPVTSCFPISSGRAPMILSSELCCPHRIKRATTSNSSGKRTYRALAWASRFSLSSGTGREGSVGNVRRSKAAFAS